METPERLPKEHPAYEARLRAQHGMVLSLGALPAGLLGGLILGVPLAQRVEGLPLSLGTTGILSVLLILGLGLMALGLLQGAARLAQGFWQMEHGMDEISGEKRLAWYTAVTGLFFLSLGLGFSLAYLVA